LDSSPSSLPLPEIVLYKGPIGGCPIPRLVGSSDAIYKYVYGYPNIFSSYERTCV
jgi:hypothetical protein